MMIMSDRVKADKTKTKTKTNNNNPKACPAYPTAPKSKPCSHPPSSPTSMHTKTKP